MQPLEDTCAWLSLNAVDYYERKTQQQKKVTDRVVHNKQAPLLSARRMLPL